MQFCYRRLASFACKPSSIQYCKRYNSTTTNTTKESTAAAAATTLASTGSTLLSSLFNPTSSSSAASAASSNSNLNIVKPNNNNNNNNTTFISNSHSHCLSILATKNNTILTLANAQGQSLVVASAGSCGLKKANRGTGDAGYQAALKLIEKCRQKALPPPHSLHLLFKGFGPGRDQAFRAIKAVGWSITRVSDRTPIRFGGCRPKKKRRL